jgi:hypothetical protein
MLRFGCILATRQDSEFDTLAHWLCLRWLHLLTRLDSLLHLFCCHAVMPIPSMKETIGFSVHLFALAMHLLLVSLACSLWTVNSLNIVSPVLRKYAVLMLCWIIFAVPPIRVSILVWLMNPWLKSVPILLVFPDYVLRGFGAAIGFVGCTYPLTGIVQVSASSRFLHVEVCIP